MEHMKVGLKGGLALLALATACLGVLPATAMAQQQVERPERLGGKPNLNGIWQVMNSANWNLEPHNAEQLKQFWQLGALGAMPAGRGVVDGGEIPYLPEALAQRDKNRASWPKGDPETNCYLPGIPRATYMDHPFQIVQSGAGDIYIAYEYHSANRMIRMNHTELPPIDTWMGESRGKWDGDTLVVESSGFNGKTWLDRSGNFFSNAAVVTETFKPIDDSHIQYTARIEDSNTFSRPWTISMVLYRNIDRQAELMEFRCVPFVEELFYHDLNETAATPGQDK
jgi:hypothetical protein